MSYLVFIDTNILLDYYRQGNDVSLSLFKHINQNHDQIITTDQVEMEYMKNRQKEILNTYRSIKRISTGELQIPSFLKGSTKPQTLQQINNDLNNLVDKIKGETEKLLENPEQHDDLFIILQRLFDSKKMIHLFRNSEHRQHIRELAKKRFLLGYPPRKPGDTSIGDSINWEWIIHCAKEYMNDIVIVTRDKDYGESHKNISFLNDWLLEEFKERAGNTLAIKLTQSLAEGFKLSGIKVTKKQEQAEREFLSTKESIWNSWIELAKYNIALKITEQPDNIHRICGSSEVVDEDNIGSNDSNDKLDESE